MRYLVVGIWPPDRDNMDVEIVLIFDTKPSTKY
jgi:hypothetical protein